MSYFISASGHAASEEAERKLHAELAGVLAKPEYGCGSSSFSGSHVQGTIHLHNSPGTEHKHHTTERD
jgi:hypothetical protein